MKKLGELGVPIHDPDFYPDIVFSKNPILNFYYRWKMKRLWKRIIRTAEEYCKIFPNEPKWSDWNYSLDDIRRIIKK